MKVAVWLQPTVSPVIRGLKPHGYLQEAVPRSFKNTQNPAPALAGELAG
jgi:hypothetical protein